MLREQAVIKVGARAEDAARDRILDILLPQPNPVGFANEPNSTATTSSESQASTRQKMLRKLLAGDLDEREVEFDISSQLGVEIMTPPGMEEMASQLQGMFQNMGNNKTQKRKMKIKDALPVLLEEESAKLINDEEVIPYYLSVGATKEEANDCYLDLPREKGVKHELQAVHIEELHAAAEENGFVVAIVDKDGQVIKK